MWWKNGIIYQIYPLSFMDSNNDGKGDIRGIISKLDYLNDGTKNSLGIDAIWLSPIYPSTMYDFGYDITDYNGIDPTFGTLDDFKTLLTEAHKRNIKIIMDMVLVHTSDEHPWFVESRKDKTNPRADWYIWHPGKNGRPPNNWFSYFDLKSGWRFNENRDEYYLALFSEHQPELNWRNPEVKKAIFDMLRYWLDMGVDGFRLDVAHGYIKDNQFRDNPYRLNVDYQKHIYDRNRPEAIDICKEIRAIMDEYDDRMVVGEVYMDDSSAAAKYYGENDDGLNMAFNFNFTFQPWNGKKIYKAIMDWYNNLLEDAWPDFTFSNHDNPRHAFRYRAGKWTDARVKVAVSLLLTLRGTPFLYYGEEIGMDTGKLKRKDMVDPLGLKTWPFKRYNRDLARTPMQWDDSKYTGFSDEKPWLPVDTNYMDKNVKVQEKDEDSILSFYKRLIWMRKAHTSLQLGKIKFYEQFLPKTFVYVREDKDETMLVVLNFTKKRYKVNLCAVKEAKGELMVQFASHRQKEKVVDINLDIEIQPYEVLIMLQTQ